MIGWSEPEINGGSEIIQYVVEKCDVTRGSRTWVVVGTVGPSEKTFRALRLFQGNLYLFRVVAENQAGPGPSVELAEPVMAKLPYGTLRSLLIYYFMHVFCLVGWSENMNRCLVTQSISFVYSCIVLVLATFLLFLIHTWYFLWQNGNLLVINSMTERTCFVRCLILDNVLCELVVWFAFTFRTTVLTCSIM